MIWPLASEYAKRGWAVRRVGWNDEAFGDSGASLRWIMYQSSLFWLVYREAVTGTRIYRVVRNTDFKVEDFYAEDWTVLSPSCYGLAYVTSADQYQQGKLRYPRAANNVPVNDPTNPNAQFGECPVVPLYGDIRNQSTP